MVISTQEGNVFTGGYDGTVRRWDSTSGRELGVVTSIGAPVDVLALAPDAKTLALGPAGLADTVRLWDITANRESGRLARGQRRAPVSDAAFSPDGKTIAAGLQLWDTATGAYKVSLIGGNQGAERLANFTPSLFTPDGRKLISVGTDGIREWDASSGKFLRLVIPTPFKVRAALAISADGRFLARGNYVPRYRNAPAPETRIRIFDLSAGRELASLEGHTEHVRNLAFSPDGRLLASCGGADRSDSDACARIWDVARGKELRRLAGHRGAINAVAFTPDGKRVITASEDATALVWDISDLSTSP
jgi:WD40 repeat protein